MKYMRLLERYKTAGIAYGTIRLYPRARIVLEMATKLGFVQRMATPDINSLKSSDKKAISDGVRSGKVRRAK